MHTIEAVVDRLVLPGGKQQSGKDENEFVSRLTDSVETRSEEHTSELQSLVNLVCRLLLEQKN